MSQKNATIHSAFLLFFLVFSGCAANVRPGVFPESPVSVRPGSLLGPFHGTVRDASAGTVIRRARAAFTWNVQRPGQPPAMVSREVHTDVNGRYFMPALRLNPSLVGRGAQVNDVQVVVSHPDYVPYVSSLDALQPVQGTAGDGSQEHPLPPRAQGEFFQLDHVVRLARLTMDPPLSVNVVPRLLAAGLAGVDEIFYRAAAELAALDKDAEWKLVAPDLLSPEDVRKALDSDESPVLVRRESGPDRLAYLFRFEMDASEVSLHVMHMPLVEMAALMKSGVPGGIPTDLGEAWDARAWLVENRAENRSYLVGMLPHDGLLVGISHRPAAGRQTPQLSELLRMVLSRKRFLQRVYAGARIRLPLLYANPEQILAADWADLFHVFSDAALHRWIQELFSMPMGIYEAVEMRHAEQLAAWIDELPATLALRPDSRKRIRVLQLLVDGALSRLLQVQAGRPSPPVEAGRVLRLLRAALREPAPVIRQHLAAQAFFVMGQYVVSGNPGEGLRTRLSGLMQMLKDGRPGASLEMGWMVLEHPDGMREVLSSPSKLQTVSRGKVILLHASGAMEALPWPAPPEMRPAYPLLLQFPKK